MQPRLSPSRALRCLLLLCLLPAGFSACDRHPAGEPPEQYGHGSSHTSSYSNHDLDSSGNRHYSDSTGTEAAKKEPEAAAEKAQAAEPAKRLNSSGQ